jgi:hypothetical protein
MVETTLSITWSVLGSIISKATAIAEEMSLLMDVQKEIWYVFVLFISLSWLLSQQNRIIDFHTTNNSICWAVMNSFLIFHSHVQKRWNKNNANVTELPKKWRRRSIYTEGLGGTNIEPILWHGRLSWQFMVNMHGKPKPIATVSEQTKWAAIGWDSAGSIELGRK